MVIDPKSLNSRRIASQGMQCGIRKCVNAQLTNNKNERTNAIGGIWEESMLHTKAVKTSVCVDASMEGRTARNGREMSLHEEKTSCIYPEQSCAGSSAGHD